MQPVNAVAGASEFCSDLTNIVTGRTIYQQKSYVDQPISLTQDSAFEWDDYIATIVISDAGKAPKAASISA